MVKSARGEYTQSLYQIWGYALFIPHAVNLSRILFSYNHNIILYYDMYISFLSLGFLLMAILISGILIKNKLLIIFGVASPIFVASYLILRMSLGVSFKLNGFEYHIKYIIKQTTLLMIIFTALYFAFAVYYKLKGEFFSNEEEN